MRPLWFICCAAAACGGEPAPAPTGDKDTDADTDTDTDADADTDTDTDADTAPTGDTGPGAPQWNVCVDGSAAYSEIQAAVDAGETVISVCPGTYGPVSLASHAGITITGASSTEVAIVSASGPALVATSSDLTITGVRLTGYGVVDSAAAFDIRDSTATLTDVRIEGCTSDVLTVLDGAISRRSSTSIDGLVVTGNAVNGILVTVDGGGTFVLRHGVFTGNTPHPTTASYGNLLWVGGGVTGEVTNNLFYASTAEPGAYAATFDGGGLTIANNVFYGLTAGVAVFLGESPVFVDNVLQGNSGFGGRFQYADPAVVISYDLFWDNAPNVDLASPGVGWVLADAQFVDPANGDFHLLPGSPAIDAGDPAILDADGSASDLGAYGGPSGVW